MGTRVRGLRLLKCAVAAEVKGRREGGGRGAEIRGTVTQGRGLHEGGEMEGLLRRGEEM